jgi:hypothetical protein
MILKDGKASQKVLCVVGKEPDFASHSFVNMATVAKNMAKKRIGCGRHLY